MKRSLWVCAAVGLLLTACRAAPITAPSATAVSTPENIVPTALPDGPRAPELTNEVWLNSPRLTSADLRGHVVLIDFWTFG